MLEPEESALYVRRAVLVRAEPERVWRAFTTFEAMAAWWGVIAGDPEAGTANGMTLIAYEPREGGRIEMEVPAGGTPLRFGGVIQAFEPERRMIFENDWMPNQGWKKPTYVCLRLAPVLGGTLVELLHYGFERVGGDVADEYAGYEAGWGVTQLSALKARAEL